jgi:hypothetical protein
MPIRSKIQASVLAAALSLSFIAGVPAASAFECEQQVNQTLQEHGVSQSDVKSVKVTHRTGGAKSASIYGLDAWVRLNSCSDGALIVSMTKYCMVQQSYTTGGCSVGTLPKY